MSDNFAATPAGRGTVHKVEMFLNVFRRCELTAGMLRLQKRAYMLFTSLPSVCSTQDRLCFRDFQADRPVDNSKEGRNASGLRIPMFVSRVRETTDHSNERALAVDVVFHPWVMRSCKGEPMFRDQVCMYVCARVRDARVHTTRQLLRPWV